MNARLMGRPARAAAAALGALVAAGAVTLVAMAGTANAAGAGRCIDNVNVRAQPDISAQIVAVCERGQAVQVGATRDGFVELTNLGGWAAQEFVSVNGHTPAAPTTPRTTAATPTTDSVDGSHRPGAGRDTTRHGRTALGTAGMSDDATGDSTAAAKPTPTADADPLADDSDTSSTGTDPSGGNGAAQPTSAAGGLSRLFG